MMPNATSQSEACTVGESRNRLRWFIVSTFLPMLEFAATVAMLVLFPVACYAQTPVRFTDITQLSGIHFTHNNGAFGAKYLPETLGPGCAFIDYDNDGYPDILLINGQAWPGHAASGS